VSVEGVLLETLGYLRRSQSFLERLDGEGGVAELYVSLFARADFRLELSGPTMALLGRLGLSVAFDIHPQPLQAANPTHAT